MIPVPRFGGLQYWYFGSSFGCPWRRLISLVRGDRWGVLRGSKRRTASSRLTG